MSPRRKSIKVAEKVGRALETVMAIPIDDLERAMQEAHESTARQMEDPDEIFPVSRQALRMFWHFRCNLEAVPSVKVRNE